MIKKILSCMVVWCVAFTGLLANAGDKNAWKNTVPVPVFEKDPGFVELYWKAWELAHDHVVKQEGLPQTPYVDEAFSPNTLWIWDTCFMVLFCKYSPKEFPGVESLNNFYVPFHTERYEAGTYPLKIHHPDNPPLFAWVEHDNFLFNGKRDHVKKLLTETRYLQKHFDWFHNLKPGWRFKARPGGSKPVAKRNQTLGYGWNGVSSGMDNTPRKGGGLWLDAIAQQGLSALSIARMAERVGEKAMAEEWYGKYKQIKEKVNRYYWDEEDGIYYDVSRDGKKFFKVKTPAAFWPMLAEMCSPEQAERMVKHLTDPDTFGGERPWVTVARNDPEFTTPDGNYWRGGIWLPTAYMATKALEKYGYYAEADAAAERLVAQMVRTYQTYKPATIWECYSPTRDAPADYHGKRVRPDFCGWSALGPISLFIENVLGFHAVDALQGRVAWRLHQTEAHGVRNFTFGDITADLVYDGAGKVQVKSNRPFVLVIHGEEHAIRAGENTIKAEPKISRASQPFHGGNTP